MRTTRILKLLTASVAIVTATVALALFGLQGHTDAEAEAPILPTETTTVRPSLPRPTSASPTTVAPPTTVLPDVEPATGHAAPGRQGPGRARPPAAPSQPRLLAGNRRRRLRRPHRPGGDGLPEGRRHGAGRRRRRGHACRLASAVRPGPVADAAGDRVEVDKSRQVLFVVRDDAVRWVLNVSTGTEEPYLIDGRTELADTPVGHWRVGWAYDGVDMGELGGLYRPRYFHADGIAVHGYHDVPAYPASHGCVRVSNAAIDWIWAEDIMPIGSAVWVA